MSVTATGTTSRRTHSKHQSGFLDLWSLFAWLVAAIVCMPIFSVIWLALFPQENIWPHLVSTVLPDYVLTTLTLLLGVAIGTLTIGVSTAWWVTHYSFPGRGIYNWALLLPFAIPAYVLAYVYTDLLEYAGPVQSSLRSLFGWQSAKDYWFPAIRTEGGAISMLVLVLYPYVYLLARASFLEQSASVLEVAQVLGRSRGARFFHVALPMARPAIAVGVAMALMETLNDFGTVDYFAVRTLTAGIYDVWLSMSNLGGGAQIATLLLAFVMVCIGLEQISRRAQRNYQPAGSRYRRIQRIKLRGLPALAISLACAFPIVLGFLIPSWVLADYAIRNLEFSWTAEFRLAAVHSVLLSSTAAVVAITVGVLLSYSKRIKPDNMKLAAGISVASSGYAIPGAVLALGVIVPLAAFDNAVDSFFRSQFGFSTGLLLSGTVFALVFAYTVRFLAVAYGSINSSLKKISPSMDDASRSLGQSPLTTLRLIHLPLMKSGILTAGLVVFVDSMKELPATLLLRPFNYDTLATHVYQFASDELLEKAAAGSLFIVVVGLVPVILLSITIDRSRQ